MWSKADILSYLQIFIAGIGKMKCLRIDHAEDNTSLRFVTLCDENNIRRELTAPRTSQQNGPAESFIWQVLKGGPAARLDIRSLSPDLPFEQLGHLGVDFKWLWLEVVVWTSRSATTANNGMLSPHELFFGFPPQLKIVPFLQPDVMRVERASKLDLQGVLCYYLYSG